MANIYVSSAGSNTSPYDTWAKAATSPQTAVNLAGASAGNIVIFDDEMWDLSSGLSFSAHANSLTCQSRSADPDLCSWTRNSATANLLGFGAMANAITVTLKDIGLTRSATMTGAGGGAICWYSSGAADANIAFDGCKFFDITMDTVINAGTTGALIRTSAATVLSTITFTDCIFSGLNITSTSCASVISARNNIDVVVTRPVIINHVATQTGVHYGMFYCVDGDLTVTDPDVNGVTLNGTAGSTSVMNGVFFAAAGTLTISNTGNKEVRNIVSTGHAPHSLFARANGPYVISGLIVHDCSMSQHGDDSLGCAFLAYGTGSSGTYDDCDVYDCTCHNGAAYYNSQGASGAVTRLKSHGNTGISSHSGQYSAGAGLYSGGWGDITLDSCLIYGNTASEGGGVYIHRHGSLGPGVNKTATLNNCTIEGNSATGLSSTETQTGMMIKSYNASDLLTVNFNNTIVHSSNTDNIHISGSGTTAGITVSPDYCDLQNDASGISVRTQVVPNVTLNADANEITTRATFKNLAGGDYINASGSSAKYAGKHISTNVLDMRKRRRSIPPSIGAYESTGGDPAETRAVRT